MLKRQTLFSPATLAAAALVALAGCGGDGGTPATTSTNTGTPTAASVEIKGLAAIGAPIANGTVTATNKRGEKATAQTAANGSFTVNVSDGAPYLLSVLDSAGRTWYSYAQAAGYANVNPLTTLALLQANTNRPLADLATGWATRQLTDTQVLDAAKVVNANFSQLMQSKGVAPASTNIFTQTFSANGSGLDAVLDAMRVTIACNTTACTQTINGPAGTALISWNAGIATAGFTFSWTGGGTSGTVDVGVGSCRAPRVGTYSLVVQTTVSGLGGVAIPEICVDGLPAKPVTQAEFCGSGTVTQQLPPGVQVINCSYDGSIGTISARITLPFVLDYSLKYSFVQR